MASIGEKVETIVRSRKGGAFGEYLGCSAETFGAARVEGMTFKVGALAEVGSFEILHVESGMRETAGDRWEMPVAIDRLVKKVQEA